MPLRRREIPEGKRRKLGLVVGGRLKRLPDGKGGSWGWWWEEKVVAMLNRPGLSTRGPSSCVGARTQPWFESEGNVLPNLCSPAPVAG